jgi:hypothetical protein
MHGHPGVAGARSAPHQPQSARAQVPAGASGAAPGREHEALSRADIICGGSDEIPLGIIASRALGLPREPARGQDGA